MKGRFNNTHLTSIIISNGTNKISRGAFDGVQSLKNITLPRSITNIEECGISYCLNLESINYLGTIDQWNAIDFDNYWNDSMPEITIHCIDGDIGIPSTFH